MGHGTSSYSYPLYLFWNYDKDLNLKLRDYWQLIDAGLTTQVNLGIGLSASSLAPIFPEFNFSEYKSVTFATRMNYQAPASYCCINRSMDYLSNGQYLTCDPALLRTEFARGCDIVLSDYCMNPVDIELCNVWLQGKVTQVGYIEDTFTLNKYLDCLEDPLGPFCESFLKIMRESPNYTRADEFVREMHRNNPNDFKCSYPSKTTLKNASKITQPRQCWDANCIGVPQWKLLWQDYIARKGCAVMSTSTQFIMDVNSPLGAINNVTLIDNSYSSVIGPTSTLIKSFGQEKRRFYTIRQIQFWIIIATLLLSRNL